MFAPVCLDPHPSTSSSHVAPSGTSSHHASSPASNASNCRLSSGESRRAGSDASEQAGACGSQLKRALQKIFDLARIQRNAYRIPTGAL